MGSSISLSWWSLMADHHTIIRNSVCLCVCLLANRIIKWTMIHHRQVMGIQTFSSYSPPPHYLSLSFLCSYFSWAELLSLFDLRTASKACHTHCYSSFFVHPLPISVCGSLLLSPLFHSVCRFASLSLSSCPFLYHLSIVILMLSSFLLFYSFNLFVSPVLSAFSFLPIAPSPFSVPPLLIIISQQCSSTLFANRGVFIYC